MKYLIEECKQYDALEEIRVRIGRPLECIAHGKVFYDYITTAEDAIYLLNKLSQFSIYTMEEELKRGYVTLRHRIGLAGKVITEKAQ